MQQDEFYLKISSREGVLYEGNILSLTSYNESGKFDVLAQHANFISLVQNSIHIIDIHRKETDIPITSALMKVSHNTVNVYAGIEYLFNNRGK